MPPSFLELSGTSGTPRPGGGGGAGSGVRDLSPVGSPGLSYRDDGKSRVVAAMIQRDGKFLVGRRSAAKTSAPGVWCAVMGRIETGETVTVEEMGELRPVFMEDVDVFRRLVARQEQR